MMFLPEDHRMIAYAARQVAVDRRWKPNVELAPNCPRCDSSNTKFCYYNNYSLTQPRYFCKGCRRYWTKGGSLRNVPVGGGCRKNRRGKSVRISTDSAYITSTSSSSSSSGGLHHGNSRVPDSGLRPDLALDDMFDNFHNSDGPCSTLSSGGANIDMAVMYARYLNQVPELPEEAEDSFGFIGSAEAEMSTSTPSADPSCQKAGQASDQASMGFKASNFGLLSSMGELGFSVEPGMSLESLLMPMASSEVLSGSRDVFSMNWAPENPNFPWPAPQEERPQEVAGFGSGHHYQDPKTWDWSSMDHEY